MHEDKLGSGWHNKVRSLCGIKKVFLPDVIIEHETNLKYATTMLFLELGKDIPADPEETPLNAEFYRQAFIHFLGSVICMQYDLESKGTELYQKGVFMLRALTQNDSTPNSSKDLSKPSDKLNKVS